MDRLERVLAITHDLKSRLLAIKRLSEALLEEGESLPGDSRYKLQLINESVGEASEYLEDVDLSSILTSNRKEDDSSEPVSLVEMARNIVQSYRAHANWKNQVLRFRESHSRPAKDYLVAVDSVPLREAMSNLVSNALEFSPQGERVEVRVRRRGEMVSFSVTDNGPGLSEREQEHLFEPFQVVGPSPTGDEESSGVGLFIVKRIVDRYGGKIEVESSKGSGSTFTLLFPAVHSSEDSAEPNADTEQITTADASALKTLS